MKKLMGLCVFLMCLVTQPISFSFADSGRIATNSYQDVKEGKGEISVIEMAGYRVQVISDSFGGCLYSYKDHDGNECMTNKESLIGQGLVMAGSSKDIPLNESLSVEKEDQIDPVYAETDDFEEYEDEEIIYEDEVRDSIPDPFEPINRIFFQLNDKLYFWFLKPVAKGYRAIVPEPARKGVSNFFYNITFPIRFVNCLLQLKLESAGNELARFIINSTFGLAGLLDHSEMFNLKTKDEDFGQSLGVYGVTPGFFINWPILGPSSVRDTLGMFGDSLLDPLNYLDTSTKYIIAIQGLDTVNDTSFHIGDYEDLKRSALDPYVGFRNSYHQYRQGKIKE